MPYPPGIAEYLAEVEPVPDASRMTDEKRALIAETLAAHVAHQSAGWGPDFMDIRALQSIAAGFLGGTAYGLREDEGAEIAAMIATAIGPEHTARLRAERAAPDGKPPLPVPSMYPCGQSSP